MAQCVSLDPRHERDRQLTGRRAIACSLPALLAGLSLIGAGPGHALPLTEGDYWEFQWHKHRTSWAQGSSTSTTNTYGRYRLTLGSPAVIGGVTMYELLVSGDPHDNAPVWSRLGADASGRIHGTAPGSPQLTVLFDPATGVWPGSGLLSSFSSSTLVAATPGNLNNDYFTGSALVVEQTYEENSCEYFPGLGLICGGTWDQNLDRREYWRHDLGPVGAYYYNSYSSCGAGFCSGSTTTRDVGLVRSSLSGDLLIWDLESEPNQYADAVLLPLGAGVLLGAASDGDSSDSIDISGVGDGIRIHDWYRFELTGLTLVDLRLEWSQGPSDLDLVITDYPVTDSPAQSMADNVGSGVLSERIYTSLPAGTYLVGVSAFDTPGSIEYTLTHNLTPTRVSVVANPREIAVGESSLVSWTSTNAASCSRPVGGGFAQTIPVTGSMMVSPDQTATYSVTCQGTGWHTGQVTVTVVPEPATTLMRLSVLGVLLWLRRRGARGVRSAVAQASRQ